MAIEQAEQAANAAQSASGPIVGLIVSGYWKIAGFVGGFGFAAALGAFIALCMMKPRTDAEWRVALASCLATSLFGGAALIRYFGLQVWVEDWFGILGLAGVFFTCALPGWSVVRWIFNYLKKNEDKDVMEMQAQLRRQMAGVAPREADPLEDQHAGMP